MNGKSKLWIEHLDSVYICFGLPEILARSFPWRIYKGLESDDEISGSMYFRLRSDGPVGDRAPCAVLFDLALRLNCGEDAEKFHFVARDVYLNRTCLMDMLEPTNNDNKTGSLAIRKTAVGILIIVDCDTDCQVPTWPKLPP